jgi:hypothetical protein
VPWRLDPRVAALLHRLAPRLHVHTKDAAHVRCQLVSDSACIADTSKRSHLQALYTALRLAPCGRGKCRRHANTQWLLGTVIVFFDQRQLPEVTTNNFTHVRLTQKSTWDVSCLGLDPRNAISVDRGVCACHGDCSCMRISLRTSATRLQLHHHIEPS